jgi:hypothetical protein
MTPTNYDLGIDLEVISDLQTEGSRPCPNVVHDRIFDIQRKCHQILVLCGNCRQIAFCSFCMTCLCEEPRALTQDEIKALMKGRPKW